MVSTDSVRGIQYLQPITRLMADGLWLMEIESRSTKTLLP